MCSSHPFGASYECIDSPSILIEKKEGKEAEKIDIITSVCFASSVAF